MVIDIETGRRSQVTRGGLSSFAPRRPAARAWVNGSQQGSTAGFDVYRREAAGVEARGDAEQAESGRSGRPRSTPIRFSTAVLAAPVDSTSTRSTSMTPPQRPLLSLSTAEDTGNGQFSPDGRWVAYEVWEEGLPEVWVEPYPTDGRRRNILGESGGFGPIWSPAEREIFYVEDGRRMMSFRYAITAAVPSRRKRPSSSSSERSTSTALPSESSTSLPTGSASSSSTRPTPRATRSWWSRTGLRSSSAWFRRSEGQRHRAQRPRRTRCDSETPRSIELCDSPASAGTR